MDAILDFIQTLFTPLVSDTMDRLGIPSGVLDHSIQSILFDPHVKVAGYAFGCRVVPTNEYIEIDTLLDMVDAIPTDAMVMVATDADIDAALWGGLMSTRAKIRGARGAVVNGGVRDIEQISTLGFPVFGSYRCIKDIRRRGYMIEYGVPITINTIVVKPGDIVFGDMNGVVVIPSTHIEEVVRELRVQFTNESLTMQSLEQGVGASEVFKSYKTF